MQSGARIQVVGEDESADEGGVSEAHHILHACTCMLVAGHVCVRVWRRLSRRPAPRPWARVRGWALWCGC
jgi:hypothetical protein